MLVIQNAEINGLQQA